MSDLLDTAAAWLATKRETHLSQTVTYARGGLSVSLVATKAPVTTINDPQFGILRINECDWIIKASLLILGGSTVEPQERTDTITESDGQVWQVLPTNGEPAYRSSDPYGHAWRIHTKRIDGGD